MPVHPCFNSFWRKLRNVPRDKNLLFVVVILQNFSLVLHPHIYPHTLCICMSDHTTTIGGEGLRQRPTSTTTNSTSTPPSSNSMAYSTLRNKSRPVLATAISRASSSAAATQQQQQSTTLWSLCGGSSSSLSWMNHNRELRRYRNRLAIFLTIVAVYTAYIYQSGMLPLCLWFWIVISIVSNLKTTHAEWHHKCSLFRSVTHIFPQSFHSFWWFIESLR